MVRFFFCFCFFFHFFVGFQNCKILKFLNL
jgi:hypothetical protein